MGLDKAIEHGKEHRKIYRGAKSIDLSCRNHGTCAWCYGNRMHKYAIKKNAADEQLKEWKNN